MNSLRMLCSTGIDWLAHSMRRLPRSARSIFLISNEAVFTTDVAIFSCLRILAFVGILNREIKSKGPGDRLNRLLFQITRSPDHPILLFAISPHSPYRSLRTRPALARAAWQLCR